VVEASLVPAKPVTPKPPTGFLRFLLDDERRLRTLYRLVIFALGFCLIQIVLMIVFGVGLGVYFAVCGVPDDFPTWMERHEQVLMIVTAFPFTLLAMVLVWVCRRFVDRRSMESAGFKFLSATDTMLLPGGLALGAGAIGLGCAIAFAVGAYEIAPAGSISWIWFGTFFALIVMAFMEEIVVRAYVLQNFCDIGWTWAGVLLSSLGFWLMHSFNPSAWETPWVGVNLFGAGVVLSLAYLASGNIWFPTALHFAWNFMQGPILGVAVSGIETESLFHFKPSPGAAEWISGGDFGLEGSALCLLTNLLLCLILGAWLWAKRTRSDKP